jgi:hypothetical protein
MPIDSFKDSDIPKFLIKAFDEIGHAKNFLHGNIKIDLAEKYKTGSDWRKDETEKRSENLIKGEYYNLIQSSHYISDVYILCFYGVNAKYESLETKNYPKVKIFDPVKLIERLAEAWKKQERAMPLEYSSVLYEKGQVYEAYSPLHFEIPTNLLFEKPPEYANENEFRLLFKCDDNSLPTIIPSTLFLNIGPIDDIASFV